MLRASVLSKNKQTNYLVFANRQSIKRITLRWMSNNTNSILIRAIAEKFELNWTNGSAFLEKKYKLSGDQ